MSGDGRYVAFVTHTNFDPLDAYGYPDIYVRDRDPSSPTTTLISVNSLGTAAGDNYSYEPRISHDGSTVAFLSYASDLDGTVTDTNGQPDVFLRKWRAATPVTDLVSRHRDGLTSGDHQSWAPTPTISENGVTVAFISNADDLTTLTDRNGTSDVFAVKAAAISITPLDAAKPEGNSGTTGFTFTVSRHWFTGNAVALDWAVTGSGTAPANAADFGSSFPSGSVSFAAGETEKTITFNVVGDPVAEAHEGFTVTLSNSSNNSQIVVPTADGTIQDDDTAHEPVLANDDAYTIEENTALQVETPGVLGNDVDTVIVELLENVRHGELALKPDGSFTYTPAPGFNREDSFQYRASDGVDESDIATVTITIETEHPWHNSIHPVNVNDDKYFDGSKYVDDITPLDALLVINNLNANGVHTLPLDRPRPLTAPFLDVSRDGQVTPFDAVLVINYLNSGEGEGERPATIADAAVTSWTLVANSEILEPGTGDMRNDVVPVGVRAASSSLSTNFLQSLDLLFAKLDEAQTTTPGNQPPVAK